MQTAATITEPLEVRHWRYRSLRRDLFKMWLRSAAAGLIVVSAFVAFILAKVGLAATAEATGLRPAHLLVVAATLPLVVAAILFALILADARFSVRRCAWTASHLRMDGRRYRWSTFQRFHTLPVPAAPGLETLMIQFRDRWLDRGLWLSFSASTGDIADLAAAASAAGVPRVEPTRPAQS